MLDVVLYEFNLLSVQLFLSGSLHRVLYTWLANIKDIK